MFFVTSLLLAGAAYAAYRLWKQISKGNSGGGHGDDPRANDHSSSRPRDKESPIRGREDLIRKVVDGVRFSSAPVVIGKRSMGTESRPSIVPADDIVIRPMRGIGEMGMIIPSSQVLDDETYYARLAANELLVKEDVENVELSEDVYGEPRKALVWLQDVSGSMENDRRINWSLRLGERLIDKCLDEGAEIILVPFDNKPGKVLVASTRAEAEDLRRKLPNVIKPGGGTDIGAAIMAGLDAIESRKVNEARMVLVTDGTVGIDDEVVERMKEKKISLHTICIAGGHYELESISERYDLLEDPVA